MSFGLSESEFHQFWKDGFIGPFTIYERWEVQQELAHLRGALADRRQAAYDLNAAGSIANYDRHLDVPFLNRHIRKPEIVDRVRKILGEDLLCWRTEFFVKNPGDEGTDWHQSRNLAIGSGVSPLLATEPHPIFPDIFLTLSVWTALTDTTLDNGCLQVMPGTQEHLHYDESKRMTWRPESINNQVKNGIKRGLFGYDSREIQLDPKWAPNEKLAVSLEMDAGQAVMLWEATMHGSTPNISSRSRRVALVARYVPTQVRVYPNMTTLQEYGGCADLGKWGAVLVSGVDRYRHNRVVT